MRVLFIVGYWNSGTTLLVRILRHHPMLKLRKTFNSKNLEEHTVRRILKKFNHDFFFFGDYKEVIENGFKNYKEPGLSEKETEKFRKLFYKRLRAPKKKILFLKKPRMFFFKNFLDRTFPKGEMKKIVIIRNGYSQVVSKDYWLNSPEEPKKQLLTRAHFWYRAMEYYFKNWHNDPETICLRYESLCNNPERELGRICDFAGIDFEEIRDYIPEGLESRMDKWDKLDESLKREVTGIIGEMQQKLDKELPVQP